MDLNGDGMLDAISGRYSPGTITIFAGSKDGFLAGQPIEERPPAKSPSKADGTKGRPKTDMSYWMATTNVVDWDGDGDFDLIVGNVKGAVFLNRNQGSKTEYRFGRREPLMTVDGPMKVVQKSDPLPVDWDGDGRLDILVGDEAADVSFFRGRADGKFERGVSLWTGESIPPGERYRDAKKRLEGKARVPGYRLRLETCDWNRDGKLDLLVGNCATEAPAPGSSAKRGKTIGNVYLFLRK